MWQTAKREYRMVVNRKGWALLLALGLSCILILSLGIGAFPISWKDSIAILWDKLSWMDMEVDSRQASILWNIRLPRVLMTAMIGAGLAIAGATMQGIFRNPLVEPGLIGVSSGAALAAVIFIVFAGQIGWTNQHIVRFLSLPIFAFAGALLITFLVYKLGTSKGKSDVALLILSGVALNALCGALIGLVIYFADDNAIRNFTFWNLGDMGGANWKKTYLSAFLILIPSLLLFSQQKALNALALGEAEAFHMGIDVQKTKRISLGLSALIVGTAVSLAGTIGFIGLVTPHIIRLGLGADHRGVLPLSMLFGAMLLVVADMLARTLVQPAELPIGIITALLGAPFFIWLLLRIKNREI